MSRLPYQDIRIIEKSTTLTGRLVGLLFADQGADVFIERPADAGPGEHDFYLDRGKIAVPILYGTFRAETPTPAALTTVAG